MSRQSELRFTVCSAAFWCFKLTGGGGLSYVLGRGFVAQGTYHSWQRGGRSRLKHSSGPAGTDGVESA